MVRCKKEQGDNWFCTCGLYSKGLGRPKPRLMRI
nr:MAG TPA: hypothetical protein [Caudoviricetes sp.]